MADISNFEEAKAAVEIGFDFVGTTLNGYVGDEKTEGPNFDLVSRIVKELDCRCIAEGRIHEPSQARKMLELGAFAVVLVERLHVQKKLLSDLLMSSNKKQYKGEI